MARYYLTSQDQAALHREINTVGVAEEGADDAYKSTPHPTIAQATENVAVGAESDFDLMTGPFPLSVTGTMRTARNVSAGIIRSGDDCILQWFTAPSTGGFWGAFVACCEPATSADPTDCLASQMVDGTPIVTPGVTNMLDYTNATALVEPVSPVVPVTCANCKDTNAAQQYEITITGAVWDPTGGHTEAEGTAAANALNAMHVASEISPCTWRKTSVSLPPPIDTWSFTVDQVLTASDREVRITEQTGQFATIPQPLS